MLTMYYLQQHTKGGRYVIDSTFPLTATLQEATSARSWLEAKQAFGFALSPIQEALLDRQRAQAE